MDQVTNGWARWMRLNTIDVSRQNYINNYNDGLERISNFEKKNKAIETDTNLRKFNSLNPDQKMLRGIGIHGGGFSLYLDWTQSCIAMSNENIIELFNILAKNKNNGLGTLVIIQD